TRFSDLDKRETLALRAPGGAQAGGGSATLRALGRQRLPVLDLGAENGQAFAHEGGEPGPTLGRHEVAVARGALGRHVDIDAAGETHLRLAVVQRRHLATVDDLGRRQHLDAVADAEDRLAGRVEVPDDLEHTRIDANIFRTAAAGDVDGVIVGLAHLLERLVQLEEMAQLLRVGLVAFEIVQARLDDVPGLLLWADDMDGVANGLHRLLEDEDLVFLAELADQHQDLLAGHHFPPILAVPRSFACIRAGSSPLKRRTHDADREAPPKPRN